MWIANEAAGRIDRQPEALCRRPVRAADSSTATTLGAIHVYLEHGRFRQSDFDFAISLANIAAVALARARRESRIAHRLSAPGGPIARPRRTGRREPADARAEIQDHRGWPGPPAACWFAAKAASGKELVARALHRASPRADRPMLSVNCAAIPADLMESQLFGHKAGSFTGADRDHAGYFQQADLGTLFLDEVGEMTLEGQAKLLRILEGHPFLPVGATKKSPSTCGSSPPRTRICKPTCANEIPRRPVLSAQRVRAGRAAAARTGARISAC